MLVRKCMLKVMTSSHYRDFTGLEADVPPTGSNPPPPFPPGTGVASGSVWVGVQFRATPAQREDVKKSLG